MGYKPSLMPGFQPACFPETEVCAGVLQVPNPFVWSFESAMLE